MFAGRLDLKIFKFSLDVLFFLKYSDFLTKK